MMTLAILMLKSLHLDGVSWVTPPPFGQLLHLMSLTLIRIYGLVQIRPGVGAVTDKSFMQLKQIVLDTLPELTEWVGVPNALPFSRLEKIFCRECPKLSTLPFLLECSTGSYNHLLELEIKSCPKLFLPHMPHTSTLTRVYVSGSPGRMEYARHGLSLTSYRCALAWHNMASKLENITFVGRSTIPGAELPKLTSLRKLGIHEPNILIYEEPSILSMKLLSNLTSLTSLELVDCTNITMDGFNPLITAVNLKELVVYNTTENGPRSVAADLLSELAIATTRRRGKLLLPPAVDSFQLKVLCVDTISAALAAPICSLFASTLHTLQFKFDERMESLTEEEENALQLLTSLQKLEFYECPGLPSLPQRLHSVSSLRTLQVFYCPEIRSLPEEGINTSLREITIMECSPELKEQAKKLKRTNQDLQVYVA